jgi:uncharacterized membrane protein YeaQ/YmgE (transglycosylase-associated protein family)
MFIAGLGVLLFGLILGWMAYRTLRLKAGTGVFADIVAVVGALIGAAIIALFRSDVLFGLYSIGLALGFFAYVGIDLAFYGKLGGPPWRAVVLPPGGGPVPVVDSRASGAGTGAESKSESESEGTDGVV